MGPRQDQAHLLHSGPFSVTPSIWEKTDILGKVLFRNASRHEPKALLTHFMLCLHMTKAASSATALGHAEVMHPGWSPAAAAAAKVVGSSGLRKYSWIWWRGKSCKSSWETKKSSIKVPKKKKKKTELKVEKLSIK